MLRLGHLRRTETKCGFDVVVFGVEKENLFLVMNELHENGDGAPTWCEKPHDFFSCRDVSRDTDWGLLTVPTHASLSDYAALLTKSA
jgi:hypothetical protein